LSLTGRDIVCLSTHYWDERWYRKQEFMSRFALANRVLFVEPSYSMARRPRHHLRDIATNRVLRPRLERRADNLFLLKPPRGLPKWTDPRVERLTYRWYGSIVGKTATYLGFREAILWVYRPGFIHGFASVPHRQLVLDLVDDLAAYDETPSRQPFVEAAITDIARRAHLLVVTASTLAERYGGLARRVEHIPNGYDSVLFSPETVHSTPADLDGVPRPIVGFIGTLFSFLDFDLLERVAQIHHDKSLVLVGPVEANVRGSVARLVRHTNVTHIEGKSHELIPSYIAEFDVCLNPFRQGRVADSINPLKVYECLAMGKPVVSMPMEALRREPAGRVVLFADDYADFCRQIERSLMPDIQETSTERRAAVASYSWEQLFERLDFACTQALGG
jgi:glycosyltransferase involved in cell wall biosynthesis